MPTSLMIFFCITGWVRLSESESGLSEPESESISETPRMLLHGLTWPYIPLHSFALQAITSNYIVITRYYMHVMDM